MSWYWIVLIMAIWLPGALWGSLLTFQPPDWFGHRREGEIVHVGPFLGLLFWPLIGYIACVHMLYKRHLIRTQRRPGNYPGPWMAGDVIFILIFSLAWPAIFAIQYSLKRMVNSAT